ncbi:DUF5362 family protein [Caldicellulosiruptoraceae bacterium PP1]
MENNNFSQTEQNNPSNVEKPNNAAMMQILSSSIKWSNFVGVMWIISGAITCITIIGIILGIPMIIMGVKLLNLSESLKVLQFDFSNEGTQKSFDALNRYLKVHGIYFILYIICALIPIIIFIIILLLLPTSFMHDFSNSIMDGIY